METRFLAECPQAIPTVAAWLSDEFKHLDSKLATPESAEHQIKNRLNTNGCPVTFLSFEGEALTGTASLVEYESDFESHPFLTPWLSDVYVQPTFRNCGHGAYLVKLVAKHAQLNKYRKLYLFTEDRQSFYRRLGWVEALKLELHGVPISVMELSLKRR